MNMEKRQAVAQYDSLESAMLGLPQVACDVVHAFAPGLYIRQVALTAGSLVMGHRHKQAHLNIMLSGRMTLFNADSTRDELTAPVIVIAPPGRKVAYVHENTIWLNIYATAETDIAKLEAELLDKSEAWSAFDAVFKPDCQHMRDDFARFLWETGYTAQFVRAESEVTTDLIPFPQGAYKCRVGASPIEGKGLLCTADIKAGEMIAYARIDNQRTPAGRYTNHSDTPNARFFANPAGDIYLMASKAIGGALGGQDGEEITVDYRDALKLNRSIPQ